MLHCGSMSILSFATKHWQHLYTVYFFAGFVIDSFLLPDATSPFTKYIGLAYLIILGLAILLREWIVSFNTASRFEQKAYGLLTFGVLFFSGASLSFVFIYALRSAAFAVSWPLLLILFLCMVANEIIDTHQYRFMIDMTVFFISLVFYTIFNIPVLFGMVNNFVFLVAIAMSVLMGLVFVWRLRHISETAEHESSRAFALAIGVPMFVGMLYMLNVIPAVPLSLKESGIYRAVARTPDGNYFGQKETDSRFLSRWRRPVYHITDNNTAVYYFSSVGAPAEVSAPLTHVWEYYDEATRTWVMTTTIAFDMKGGRGEGYRAYSKKENVFPGMWRVTVKVDENRIVGRIRFYIKEGAVAELQEKKL
jgi:hypothetical protein